MVVTVKISDYIHVQGTAARTLPDGRVSVRVNGKEYIGMPLN